MTIHLRPVERRRVKADTRALKAASQNIHAQLRAEVKPRNPRTPSQRRRQSRTG